MKLTKSDLTRIVKQIISEDSLDYGKEPFSEKIDELYVELHNYYKNSQKFIADITNKLDLLTNEITNSNLSDDDKELLYDNLDDYEDGNLYPLSKVLDKIHLNLFGEEGEY
jgi:hypothetical protein